MEHQPELGEQSDCQCQHDDGRTGPSFGADHSQHSLWPRSQRQHLRVSGWHASTPAHGLRTGLGHHHRQPRSDERWYQRARERHRNEHHHGQQRRLYHGLPRPVLPVRKPCRRERHLQFRAADGQPEPALCRNHRPGRQIKRHQCDHWSKFRRSFRRGTIRRGFRPGLEQDRLWHAEDYRRGQQLCGRHQHLHRWCDSGDVH